MGYFGHPNHPDVVDAIEKGHRKLQAVGKPSGILVGDSDQAQHWLQSGFTFVACGTNLTILARGVEALLERVKAGAA